MIESIALKLDTAPINAIWRLLLGVALFPIYASVWKSSVPKWLFLLYILFVLLSLRIVPLVLRKIMRFSSDAQTIWSDRRQLAKIYDSYQWRKLFWIGLGLAAYLRYANVHDQFATAIAWLFTIGGAIGLFTWMGISRKIKLESAAKVA
jgi:FtsH-binding integral membrane protein